MVKYEYIGQMKKIVNSFDLHTHFFAERLNSQFKREKNLQDSSEGFYAPIVSNRIIVLF